MTPEPRPTNLPLEGFREKRTVALTSVFAAVFLTGTKLAVGLATGSLGILSEAAHSGLDLVAAAITYFAVRVSDKPADADHRYGHGKIENLSALIETLLLLVTCVWIVMEAIERLFYKHVAVEATFWAFAVIVGSIVVDLWRSRALMRVAKKYRSQALEADALHFSTDVWSSAVVLLGLGLVKVGDWTGSGEVLAKADSAAALAVAGIVVYVSARLGKRTIDVLLDRAPRGLVARIEEAVREVEGVLECGPVRLRESGRRTFVDLEIDVDRLAPFERSHEISTAVELRIGGILPEADVIVHVNPRRGADESLLDRVRTVAANRGHTVHNILLFESDGRLGLELHMEVDERLDLARAHALASELEVAIRAELPSVTTVTTRIDPRGQEQVPLQDVTAGSDRVVERVERLVAETPGIVECHDVAVRKAGESLALSMHCTFDPALSVAEVHRLSTQLERSLRKAIRGLARVTLHAEPVSEVRRGDEHLGENI